MTRTTVRVEVETLPGRLHEHSRDWGELAISRLLAEPLYVERPYRGLDSRLIAGIRRVNSTVWRLTLRDDVRWANGARLSSNDVCEQVVRARGGGRAGLVASLMIRSLETRGSNTVDVTTSIPVAHLNRILCNPALSPRTTTASGGSGAYVVSSASPHEWKLRAIHSERPNLSLVASSGVFPDAFTSSQVDISGPTCIWPAHRAAAERDARSSLVDLDIAYALIIPDNISTHLVQQIRQCLDRRRICEGTGHAVTACDLFAHLWNRQPASAADGDHMQQTTTCDWPATTIEFTPHPHNREIAESVADLLQEQLGNVLRIKECPYEEFLMTPGEDARSAFRLVLSASPWPHPAASLAPFFFSKARTPEFTSFFLRAMNEDDLSTAQQHCESAELELINQGMRVVPLGRVIGCVRSTVGPIWCPPSGFWDPASLPKLSEVSDL